MAPGLAQAAAKLASRLSIYLVFVRLVCIVMALLQLRAAEKSREYQVSAETLIEYVAAPETSMRYTEWLGVSKGRAVIAVHSYALEPAMHWTRTLYWTEARLVDPVWLQDRQGKR